MQFYAAALEFAVLASNDARTCPPSLVLVENMVRNDDDDDDDEGCDPRTITSAQHYTQAVEVSCSAEVDVLAFWL